MELFIFARFTAREGQERAVAAAMLEVLIPTRQEPGCVEIHDYRSIRDPRLFVIHSRWQDEAAFDLHARLPHTVRFLEQMERLTEPTREITRAERIA